MSWSHKDEMEYIHKINYIVIFYTVCIYHLIMSTRKHTDVTELTIIKGYILVKNISASIGKTSKQARYLKISRNEVGSIFKRKCKPEIMDAYYTFL